MRKQAPSLAIVVNENDRPDILSMVVAATEKYDMPLVVRFSREKNVSAALKNRANLIVLCEEGASFAPQTGNPAFKERTNYHLSASPSGELLVRKQEVRTPIVEVPNVMDLLNKRRQTTGETVAPSIHSLK